MQQAVPAVVPFQSASLYVGDLHIEVTEVSYASSLRLNKWRNFTRL